MMRLSGTIGEIYVKVHIFSIVVETVSIKESETHECLFGSSSSHGYKPAVSDKNELSVQPPWTAVLS